MKKSEKPPADDMPKEYDFSKMGPGVRGKYAGRLQGMVLVAVDAELAEAFPTSSSVNQALRSVLEARAGTVRHAASVPRRATGRLSPRKK
jgi:hypothetical protein